MKIKEIKGNTFCIDTGMVYIPFYKINDEDIIMLDSGLAKGEREGIDEILKINKLKVAGIICSHAHIDHIGNNNYLKEKHNCIIAMPAYEAFICSSAVNLKLYYNKQTLSELIEHFDHMICEIDIKILPDQDEIYMCGTKFKFFHTPGHSPAHICIITPDDVAYLGDALISYEVMEEAKMPYSYILTEDLKSKKKLQDLKCSKYIVAHQGMYNDIIKLIDDNIEFYKNRASRVYDVIDGAMTMEDIFRAVIKSFNIRVNNRYRYAVIYRMLESYVEYLNEIGALELNIEDGVPKYFKYKGEIK